MGTVMFKTRPRIGDEEVETDDDPNIDLDIPINVKNVFIDGLSRSQNSLITNQLERLFSVKTFTNLMDETNLCKRKLARLGVFKEIEVFIDVADSDDPDDFDVYYHVREYGAFSGGGGTNFGNMEGEVSLYAKLNNIRGVGEALKMQISHGTKAASSYDFSWTKPLLQNTDQLFSVNAFKSMADIVPSFFKEKKHGLGASLTLPGPLGVHTLGWDYHWRENFIDASAPFEIREQCGHSLKSAFRHTFLSDGRNDWIFPSEGHLFKHNIEYSGLGGNVNVIKTDLEVQLNKEILPDIILAGSIQAGGLRSLSDLPLLINDRYFLGGPLSVRGYVLRGIGQHADQASLGGEMFWSTGLHLYTPLPFRPGKGGFGELFRMHFFANAGNLTNLENLATKDFMLNPRLSYGFGLMIIMGGMARLELNYCIPRNAQPDDITSPGFQIGVGLNFL